MRHTSERVPSRLKPVPPSLPQPPFPRPSPQGTPEARPSPILGRLSSTSHSRAAPRSAWLRAAPAGAAAARWARRKRRQGVAAGGGGAAGGVAPQGRVHFLSAVPSLVLLYHIPLLGGMFPTSCSTRG